MSLVNIASSLPPAFFLALHLDLMSIHTSRIGPAFRGSSWHARRRAYGLWGFERFGDIPTNMKNRNVRTEA